ncbi:MAG: DUF3825 domain-containing protein [Acidimicrobiia bacterium]
MTLHESKNAGYPDLGRLQRCAGDTAPEHAQTDLGSRAAGDDRFERLARLAEPENWAAGLAVLRAYVEWTFERLHRQRRVHTSPDGGHHVFNTGLATPRQEAVYGLFVPSQDPDGPPWQLDAWLPERDPRLHDAFPELPGPATYTDDPADFVYDWRRELSADPRQLLETKDDRAVLPGPLRSNPYQAGLVLESAVHRAAARARRGHRTAVPCWDAEQERVHLLLPLALTTPDGVDVALVVAREGAAYQGHTILGLAAAYARARQLSRPGEWLGTHAQS